ncbi:amidohydrolase [Halobaculum sp. MBLA0147]|uniref:amidohydrolase n=1 Tax=Halobaculum sp. MBLA0147 TaxID=3079934 RepID=UPI0035235EDB
MDAATETEATLAVTGGRVLDPSLSVRRTDVLVDRTAGEILAVEDDLAGEADETLDASGGLVIPGLVNAHCHMAMTLLRGYAAEKPLMPWLTEEVGPVEATFGPEAVRAGTELALVELIQSGVTAVGDMYFETASIVEAVEQSGIRALLGFGAVTVTKDDEGAQADVDESVAVAERYDGAADGRIRTAVMPHSLTSVEPGYLAELGERAAAAELPLHFHANETTGEVDPVVAEHGQRPLAFADDRDLLRDTYVAHGVHLDDAEIELAAERGVGVAHCPAANAKLASGIAPVQRLRDAGVTVGIGTDGPASNDTLDVFDEMRAAARVGKLADGNAGDVTAETVVEMATAGGADLLGFDAGRIEPGRAADLAVVDLDAPHLTPVHDPVKLLVYAATASDVRHTVADGEVVMRDREVLAFDTDAVERRAREAAHAAVERAAADE